MLLALTVVSGTISDLVASTRVNRGYTSHTLRATLSAADQAASSIDSTLLCNSVMRLIETVYIIFGKFRARRNAEIRMQFAFISDYAFGVENLKKEWVVFKKLAEFVKAKLARTVQQFGSIITATKSNETVFSRLTAAEKASRVIANMFRRVASTNEPELLSVPIAMESWESTVTALLTSLAQVIISFTFTLKPEELNPDGTDFTVFIKTWKATRFFSHKVQLAKSAADGLHLEEMATETLSKELVLQRHLASKDVMNLLLSRLLLQVIQTLAIAQFWRIKPFIDANLYHAELTLIENAKNNAMEISIKDADIREDALLASFAPLIYKLESFQ